MEKDDRDASSYDNTSLNAFFARLEDVLRSALSAFFDQTPGLGEKSTDVRTMLNVLHLKWDDSAGTGKSPASAVVHLEGSPVVAAHFKFIKTLLNRFHHSQKTNWELIKQGRDSAVCVLGALHDYANIDTLKARESLLVLWRAAKADRVGDYAYDSEPKIVVEGWPFGSERAGAGRPRVLLRGVPVGVTPAVVALALKVQDFNVPNSSVRPLGPTAMVVELLSEADRQSLLELGNLVIQKEKARFVALAKAEEEPAVVLYLPRDIELDVVAAAWGNEHHDLAQTKIGYDGGNKRVVVIQVTAKQLAEVQDKTIDILPFTPYRLRLRLPLPNLVGPALRTALRHHIPDKEIVGLTQVDPLCAVLHLRSAEAMTQLLRLRHLTTTGTTGTAASPKSGPGPTSSKAAAKGQTPPASPAKPSAKHLSAKALGGTKTGAAEVLPGSAKSPAASKEAKADKKKNKKQQGEQPVVALVLHPVVNMGIDDLGKKLGQHCQANAEIFLTIRGQRAYAEVTSEQADRALAKPFVPDGVTINVERHEGEVPLIKVGLRPSLTAVPKGQVSQAIIRAFGQLNAGRLGRIYIGPDAIHVPVSTEACLKRLLKAGSIDVVGKQLAVFDPSVVVREKRLQDLVEMHFLRKSRGALKQLQDQHAVVIAVRLGRPISPSSPEAGATTPSGRGRGRGGRGAASQAATAGRGQEGRGRGGPAKAAGRGVAKPIDKKAAPMEKPKAMEPVVEVKGSAKASVDRAMSAIESLLAKATRRQSSFIPRETRFSILLDAKMKELGQTDPDVAVFTARQPGGGLVIHMMGSDKAKVEALAQRPNHYMTKLTVASLQLNANQFKRVQVTQLTKAYGVLIEHDAKRGEVTVFGPREAAKACIEDMKPIATAGGGQARKTAAAQLTLTASHALFFKEHIHVNYRQLRVRPLKKGAIVVTGPPEDLDVVEHLVDKLECHVLPFYLSPELADGFAAYVRQQLAKRGIAAVIDQSLFSNDDEDSDSEEGEEEEEEYEDEGEDEDEDEDVTYISNCGHEDQEWAQIEVWCFTDNLVPTYTATMGFFASELPHVQKLPAIVHKYQPWVHVDTINRVVTCVSFEELDQCKEFISDALSQRGTADSRLVYAVSASTISALEPMLQQFGVEYLTYTVGDNDYRIAVQASTIVKKLMERFGLRKS